eukprot:9078130-Alexandrium_andersonii.AAC.1
MVPNYVRGWPTEHKRGLAHVRAARARCASGQYVRMQSGRRCPDFLVDFEPRGVANERLKIIPPSRKAISH